MLVSWPVRPLASPRSRGSTGRTAGDPEGNLDAPSVQAGNEIACRTLVLLWICAALQVWWVLEQPTNSLMEGIPAFQAFMKSVKVFRKSICMQDYGGPTKKPTWLYSGVLTYLVYLFRYKNLYIYIYILFL